MFRGITRATDERTFLAGNLPLSGVGNSAPVVDYVDVKALASSLVLANVNSLTFDWATRLFVGGINLNFYIIKQLPVLPPDAYVKGSNCGPPWVHLIIPRVLELTYTTKDMAGFASSLGYQGSIFPWDEERRQCLRCELDAIYAEMYELNRAELAWILDAPLPSASFPSLKQHEITEFGEYRTQRLVLKAFDAMERGEMPSVYPSHP